jgi:hypothetical protein
MKTRTSPLSIAFGMVLLAGTTGLVGCGRAPYSHTTTTSEQITTTPAPPVVTTTTTETRRP